MKNLKSLRALDDEIDEQKYILKEEFKILGQDIKLLIDSIPVYKASGIGRVLSFLNLDGVVKDTAVRLFESYTMGVIRKKNWNPIVGIAINSFVFPLVGGLIKSNAMRLFMAAIKSQAKPEA